MRWKFSLYFLLAFVLFGCGVPAKPSETVSIEGKFEGATAATATAASGITIGPVEIRGAIQLQENLGVLVGVGTVSAAGKSQTINISGNRSKANVVFQWDGKSSGFSDCGMVTLTGYTTDFGDINMNGGVIALACYGEIYTLTVNSFILKKLQ